MWLKYNQFKVMLNTTEERITEILAAQLQLPAERIRNLTIQHKSLDARHKINIFFLAIDIVINVAIPNQVNKSNL